MSLIMPFVSNQRVTGCSADRPDQEMHLLDDAKVTHSMAFVFSSLFS